MKRSRFHIAFTWIILICFAAGQWAVYAHYHPVRYVKADISKGQTSKTTVSETCQLCDAVLHHAAATPDNQVYFIPLNTTKYVYKQEQYDFVSIALILSAGRAPPVS